MIKTFKTKMIMKTEFMSMDVRCELFQALLDKDKKLGKFAISEIERLEGVIKNYEIGIEQAMRMYESPYNKTPSY